MLVFHTRVRVDGFGIATPNDGESNGKDMKTKLKLGVCGGLEVFEAQDFPELCELRLNSGRSRQAFYEKCTECHPSHGLSTGQILLCQVAPFAELLPAAWSS